MKKLGILVLGILLFASCGSDRKILIEGTTFVELNVRSTPDSDEDNVIDDLDPGDIVRIISFKEGYDNNGISWCEIKLDRPERHEGKELKYAWVAYKVKSLPFVVSNETWERIKRMYEMEYEKGINEMLTGSRTWVTQAVYDYVYYDGMKDIKYNFDNRNLDFKEGNPIDEYEIESPSHSVDYSTKDTYPQYCRSRMSTASKDRDATSLYAVIFNQTPRQVHFFMQDKRSNRGSFVKSFDFSSSLNSNIKSIQRKTHKSKVYYADYYGYKTRLNLNYDAIRIRPQSGRERYIIYNNNNYTSSNLDNLHNLYIKEEY